MLKPGLVAAFGVLASTGQANDQQLIALDASLRILVVSALSDKATGIAALKKGARGFLCKPFTDEQLSAALSELTED